MKMMKKMIMMAMLMTIVVAAQAMSFTQARQEALFLSDKMAYELHLTVDQYEAVYEINLDYFLSIRYEEDVFGIYWNRRNTDLRYVLNAWQYRKYITTVDFYQPARWSRGSWVFDIYSRYDRGNHFRQPPKVYVDYRGGRNRGTISYYENRPINKPADRHVNDGHSWNQPNNGKGNGNGNHFSQPGGNKPGNGQNNGYQPGTNNRQNNSNDGTRKFGQGQGQKQEAGSKKQESGSKGQGAGQSNNSGHFGGQRK